jgi:hypothetical protein
MPSFPELQSALRAGLATGQTPAGLTAASPGEVARRFAVYQNNVAASLRAALARRFPVVARLVGAEFAAALFSTFARAHPPRSPLLLAYGAGLPGFLETFPPVRRLPYLPDVARLELARGRAYHAADADPMPAAALAEAAARDADGLRFRLHPSLQIVASPHPVHSIWASNQPGAAPRRLVAGTPEHVLVARDGSRILTEPLGEAEAAFVAALADAECFAAAAGRGRAHDAEFDPAPALARLIASRQVTGAGHARQRSWR